MKILKQECILSFYKETDRHLVALDCVIFAFDGEDINLLFIKRAFEPSKGKWSLMGGFLKKDESLDEAAKRILFELTGLNDVFMEQLLAFGEKDRDPGERTISVAFYALIKIDESDKEKLSENNAYWKPINDIPNLIFDHNEMVDKALKRLRRKAKYQPIGFELLPEKFTMPQLQKLYEGIYQKNMDKRNFSKKMLAMNILERTNEKVYHNSKKGAFLYSFDKEKYEALLKKGFHFEIP